MIKNTKRLLFPYLLILYEVVLYLSNDMYLPSMPVIANELMFTEHQIQATLTLWFLGASSLQFILGPLSDRFGRRIIILLGAVSFIIASIFCAIADTLSTLLIARFVQGAAVCSLVAGYAAVHESFTTTKAIKLFAIIGAITILAPALGPLFGAILVQFADWRYIFWFLASASFLILISLFLYLPETNIKRKKINTSAIVQNYSKIITNKNFLIPCMAYFLILAVEFLWAFESPFIMMEVYKTSILYYGAAQTIIFSCFLFGAIATKLLLDRYSIKVLMKFGIITTITGMFAFWILAIYYPSIHIGVACMMLIAFGTSILAAPLIRIALESCKQPTGAVTAVFMSIANLSGVAIGIILIFNKTNSLFYVASTIAIFIILALYLVSKVRIPTANSTRYKKLF